MKLFYRKLGQGKPLFILHGLFGLSDNWATVGKILSEHFEVYLIDLRNHGSSPHSSEWTYPVMAQDIKELAEQVFSLQSSVFSEQPRIVLMGHSMGGKIAMQFASMYPQMLEKLIVVDMAPKDYFGNSFDFIAKLPDIDLSRMKSRKEAEVELKKIIDNNPTIQLLLKNIQWSSGEPSLLEWKFNLDVIVKNESTIGRTFSLGEEPVNVPVLFVTGAKSNYILDSDIPLIKKHFPKAEFKAIEGAGHWTHADKPAEFAQAVIEFAS